MNHCSQCGMPVEYHDYHPYAACLMFMQCHDSRTVDANLQAVVDYGRLQERLAPSEGGKHE